MRSRLPSSRSTSTRARSIGVRLARRRPVRAAGLAAALALAPIVAGATLLARPDAPPPTPAATSALAFAEPGISPDGREIAFVSGGDIWTVPAAGGEARLLVSHPATESRPLYSPDGRSLAFVSTRTGNGDIYVLTLDTGDVRRVTFDDGREALSGWSADSRWLYYSSGVQDIASVEDVFRVAAAGGTPMPVTNEIYFNEFQGAASPDGARLAFVARGIAGSQWWRHGHSHLDESEIWLRRLGGAANGAFTRIVPTGAKSLWPMWSADGRTLFYVSDRSGSENVWRVDTNGGGRGGAADAGAAASTDAGRAVTTFTDGRVLWPSISKDGTVIAFERDFGLWTLDTASGRAKPVTLTRRGAPAGAGSEHVTMTNRFRDLAVSPDGKKLAFGARGDLFAVSAKEGGSAFRVTASAAVNTTPLWTPDSRRLVFVAEHDGSSALHVYDFASSTDTTLTGGARDYAPAIAPNGESVAFLRDARQVCVAALPHVAPPAAGAPAVTVTQTSATSRAAKPATPATSAAPAAARCIAQAALSSPIDASGAITWSPDSRWIAFLADGAKGFSNVSVVSLAGGDAKPVSFVGNSAAGSLTWSPDGTYLLFTTGQRTEPSQVARVDLVLHTPKFREDQFRDLFPPQTPDRPAPPASPAAPATPAAPTTTTTSAPATPPAPAPTSTTATTTSTPAATPADKNKDKEKEKEKDKDKPDADKSAAAKDAKKTPKPTEIVFDDIRRRLSFVPVDLDADAIAISPDGKWLLITASAAGQQNLYVYSLDELATERPVPRQITSTSGRKTDAQFTPDSKEVIYLENGRILSTPIERGPARPIAASVEMDVDFATEKRELFTQAWSLLNENFYDPQFHGVDWTRTRERFAPYAAGAATPDELRRVLSLMIGELNASHLGVGAPQGSTVTTTGRLGVRFDPQEYAASGRLQIAEIVPLGPLAVTRAVAPGDRLVAVNGRAIEADTSLDQLLEHTIDKRVVLTIESKGQRREVPVQPVALSTEKGLRYRAWVESRRAYVAKASQGRLGYVHMPDMGAASLAQLYADLDTDNHAREGVIIDIRNNNGGFVNAYALDVFTRRPYLRMTLRGREAMPARSVLGQRALESPTALVVNQESLSDAEDFTEGYRALKLGPVIGEPTAGWIIYTWGTTLLDGSSLRLPRTRITDMHGQDMERHPRPVDVAVSRQPGDEAAGRDAQLDAAIKALLAQVGPGSERKAAAAP